MRVCDNNVVHNDKLLNIANDDVSNLNTKVEQETDLDLSELFSDEAVLTTENDNSELELIQN